VIMIAIADVVGKPPTESVFFEKYSRIACVIDEVVNEVRPGDMGGLDSCDCLPAGAFAEEML